VNLRLPIRVLLPLGATLLLWSSAFAGIRAGLRAYSPLHLALLRFLIASLVLLIYAGIAHFRRPELRDVPALIFSGAVGITWYNIALNYGEVRVSAGAASLLIASTPIWTALLATIALRERLGFQGWFGVLMSFAGVALIASGEGGGIHLSLDALIILSAAVASAIYTVLQKHFLARYSALEFTAYSIWFGTLLMLPFAGGCAMPFVLRRLAAPWPSSTWEPFPQLSHMWPGHTSCPMGRPDAPPHFCI
jgi:drug/metabolite transporter (DMT)-like permease